MESEGRNHYRTRGSGGRLLAEADLPLNWGNRKRLRCVKYQRKDDASAPAAAAAAAPAENKASVAVAATTDAAPNRRAARAEKDSTSNSVLRRTASPTRQRVLRNSEANGAAAAAAVVTRSNGGGRGLTSAEMGRTEEKKSKSSSSSGSVGATAWPKFAIGLTNKEKEEDFWVLKGSKLPQRPKKRAKLVQKTLNLVSPGAWLCDLTLERYEVREKKISKKKPRGLKAMGNIESDTE